MNIFPGMSRRLLAPLLMSNEANKVQFWSGGNNNAAVASAAAITEQLSPRKIKDSSIVKDQKSEWDMAKPFDQIPGYRSFPFVGTTWSLMPFMGIYVLTFNIQVQINFLLLVIIYRFEKQ